MKTIYLALFAMFFAALNFAPAFAQSDDYNKVEASAGYSHQYDGDDQYKGFEVSATRNFSRYLGVKGDFSGGYATESVSSLTVFPAPPVNFRIKLSMYNFLGGIQIKDNKKEGSRIRPFAHALVGGATLRAKVSGTCPIATSGCPGFNYSETGFAGAFGGGIDIKVNKRFSIRAVQADYNPIWVDGGTVNNFRFGFGVVFH